MQQSREPPVFVYPTTPKYPYTNPCHRLHSPQSTSFLWRQASLRVESFSSSFKSGTQMFMPLHLKPSSFHTPESLFGLFFHPIHHLDPFPTLFPHKRSFSTSLFSNFRISDTNEATTTTIASTFLPQPPSLLRTPFRTHLLLIATKLHSYSPPHSLLNRRNPIKSIS